MFKVRSKIPFMPDTWLIVYLLLDSRFLVSKYSHLRQANGNLFHLSLKLPEISFLLLLLFGITADAGIFKGVEISESSLFISGILRTESAVLGFFSELIGIGGFTTK